MGQSDTLARWATIEYFNGQFEFYARRWNHSAVSSRICQLPQGLLRCQLSSRCYTTYKPGHNDSGVLCIMFKHELCRGLGLRFKLF